MCQQSEAEKQIADLKRKLEIAAQALNLYAHKGNWSNLTSILAQGSYNISCSNFTCEDYSDYNRHDIRFAGEKARIALAAINENIKETTTRGNL